MSALRTNRDLYLFVVGLKARFGVGAPTLERYLCGLWSLARAKEKAPSLTMPEVAALLEGAFTAPATDPPLGKIPVGEGFAGWEHRILHQIRDLREMATGGQLAGDMRYFGIDSPRGGRWYNFDPLTYLECATAGTFGGWEEGDAGGRQLVPGEVMAVDVRGQIVSVDPGEIDDPVIPIEAVDWAAFTRFLENGQWYE